jgi:hypothetical protein
MASPHTHAQARKLFLRAPMAIHGENQAWNASTWARLHESIIRVVTTIKNGGENQAPVGIGVACMACMAWQCNGQSSHNLEYE